MGLVWAVAEFLGPGGGGLLTKLFSDDAAANALSIIGLLFITGLGLAASLPQEEAALPATAD